METDEYHNAKKCLNLVLVLSLKGDGLKSATTDAFKTY